MRYYLLPGSDTRPMVWGLDKNVLGIVESELDGLLLDQEAGDLIGVVALGSVKLRPDWETHLLQLEPNGSDSTLDWDKAGRDRFNGGRRIITT